MTNENQKSENQQEDKQPAALELTDEQLEQVVGGGVIIDYGPSVHRDTIVLED